MNFIKSASAARIIGLTVLAVLAGPLHAADGTGWYIGGNIGLARAEIDRDRITSALQSSGFTITSMDIDHSEFGYKLLGGYRFSRYFALEGGFFDFGEFGFTATTSPSGSLSGETKYRGLNLDPVGILPLTERLSAFARAGLTVAKARSTYSSTGDVTAPPSNNRRAANYKFGLGLQYDFTERFGLRVEAERYRIDDAVGNDGDIDFFSLGLLYRFFSGTPAPAPAPKAEALAPAVTKPPPALVVAPAPVRTVQYCSILDIQFEIDLDGIQREEQEKLAVVATYLKKYPDTTARIEGHTDNVGTPAYNRALSLRRAQSVVDYLRDTHGIAPSRLEAVGYGDTRPLEDNRTEEGRRQNRRIGAVISCAQDIEGLTVIPARITMAMEMEFDRDQADVKPQYRDELRKVASFLKANPSVTATVEGHTDSLQATDRRAQELSQRRAQNVVNYLVTQFDVPRSRLSAEGFGQTRRFAYNTTREGQQENRRVNIIFDYAR